MINEQYAYKFCKDDISKIENYDKAVADNTHTWHLHHRLELTIDGEFAHSRTDLIRLGMYYHRPYFELIFLTKGEHCRLHAKGCSAETLQKRCNANKGNKFTIETRQKMSKSMKGKHIGKTLSSETRQKIAEAVKARWARYRQEKEHE